MNTIVVFQGARDIEDQAVKQLRDLGAENNTVQVPSGDRVRIANMHPHRSLKGLDHWGGYFGWIQIDAFANDLLTAIQADLVLMQVIFIYHQTSAPGVQAVRDTMTLVKNTRVLPTRATQHTKNLHVTHVHLLSCESATDKIAPAPMIAPVQKYADQARELRQLAQSAFVVPKVPPPDEFRPLVVTYTTGDPVTGGVTLNPFAVGFRRLPGHFNADGSWSYDDPANPDHDGDPTDGTIYSSANGNDTTQSVPSGNTFNIMGFPPP